MSIYGPRYDLEDSSSTAIDLDQISSDLDMRGNKIINLKEPKGAGDAATAGYVSNFVIHLSNHKLEKSGDRMTGNLDMDLNKITNIATPTDRTDVVNKQYVDLLTRHGPVLKPYALERYVILPQEDGSKAYFSVREKKNINLNRGLQVEIKHNISDSSQNIVNNHNFIEIESDTTPLPIPVNNPDKKLAIMRLNNDLEIRLIWANTLPPPLSILFTIKPGPVNRANLKGMTLEFISSLRRSYVYVQWISDSKIRFISILYTDPLTTHEARIDAPSDQLNHIAFVYNNDGVQLFLNAGQRKTNNLDFGSLTDITISGEELGIISLYDRELSKDEIVEHFVEHHVKNFTEDEVLI